MTMLEQQMQELRGLPARVAGVELQIVQLREELREAFSATRSELRGEMHGICDGRRSARGGKGASDEAWRSPLPDDWRSILISREVRLDADGTPWTSQRDPVMRERIREVYRKLCEEGESGRQLVAVHQEFSAELIALIKRKSL